MAIATDEMMDEYKKNKEHTTFFGIYFDLFYEANAKLQT
jgi:hypothetical protein